MTIEVKSGQDWTFDDLYRINDEIEEIALKEMGYNIYTNQIEVITSEQMLDAYASIGMPIYYNHWSFGKHFVRQREMYQSGRSGLAYEIVINSDPCIVYIMEQNSMIMQTLVMAHAGIGHNHFFKNNSTYTDWTKAGNIIDYLEFSKRYVVQCEEKYGVEEVEKILDAAHSLMTNGVFKYPRKEPLSFKKEMQRKVDRAMDDERNFNDLWKTVPTSGKTDSVNELKSRQTKLRLPEENLLYFLEQNSPVLKTWQREILRIVSNISQYFYPQSQSQIMNEGCATWTHYTIMNRLFDKGIVTEGGMFEFLKSHTGVVMQPGYDHPYYSGINPYALGFAMMQDIVRICDEPKEEDRVWFPEFAGCKDSFNVLKDAWKNYRDESFIRQFLSPRVIRDFKLFSLINDANKDHFLVDNIHNEQGYRKIRNQLADEKTNSNLMPNVEVWDVNLVGDRELQLKLDVHNNRDLHSGDASLVVKHIANLWGYGVRLRTVNEVGSTLNSYFRSSDTNTAKIVEDQFFCC